MGAGVLKIVATLLIVSALGLGGYAYMTADSTPVARTMVVPQPLANDPQVVVATQPLPAKQPVLATMVSLERVGVMPDGAFTSLDQVVGRSPARVVGRGQALTEVDFVRLNLAEALQPGELAVAIKTDLVTGVGGFLQPADRVDVLLYLRQDRKDVTTAQAQLLLSRIRLLCYGESCNHFQGQPILKAGNQASTTAAQDSAARTAVLAVPEKVLTRLMLGASAGDLRLALRGVETVDSDEGGATSRVVRITEDVMKTQALSLAELAGTSTVAKVKQRNRPAAVAEVIRGTRVERLTR